MNYSILDEDLLDKLEDEDERKSWIILETHEDFVGYWKVTAFDSNFYFDFHDDIGIYRAIAPNKLEDFLTKLSEFDYQVAFIDDPLSILDAYQHLNDIPSVEISSPFDNTINGFLPFQVQGFNKLKDLDGGVVMWSTGTGKTVCASALTRYHFDLRNFDTAFFVVKSHNRTNTQRTLKKLVDLDSQIITGTKSKRTKLYHSILNSDEPTVVITNYEKFRVDVEDILPIFEDRKILVIWDEMPTKLKTRTTKMYKSVCRCLYKTKPPQVNWSKRRPSELRQYMLSATPIEVDPDDWFNCVRLLDPRIYGTVTNFHNEYVTSWNYFDPSKPDGWKNLDRMGLKAAHIVHQVDKSDPDIAAMFPEFISEPYFVDWTDEHRKVYDEIIDIAYEIGIENIGALALITILQMFCNAPETLLNSALIYQEYESNLKEWEEIGGPLPNKKGSKAALQVVDQIKGKITNEGHAKFEALRYLICDKHKDEKICVFSALNDSFLPIIEKEFQKWGVKYVRYGGTANQRQAAEDAFKSDTSIRVFLSSDAGSDSINLEVGSVVIHLDLPWNWSTYIQRDNRIHRVTSTFNVVRSYTLLMVNSVEDRRLSRVLEKMNFHIGVFKGAIADQSASARMTQDDMYYLIDG